MSQTYRLDAVGPSYWAHMAHKMEHALGAAIERGATEPNDVPIAVLKSAQHFFVLALDAVEDEAPDNPEASVANYRIAAEVYRASAATDEVSYEDLEQSIRHYLEFLDYFSDRHPLTNEETDLARELQRFFARLSQAGERDSYAEFESSSFFGRRSSVRG